MSEAGSVDLEARQSEINLQNANAKFSVLQRRSRAANYPLISRNIGIQSTPFNMSIFNCLISKQKKITSHSAAAASRKRERGKHAVDQLFSMFAIQFHVHDGEKSCAFNVKVYFSQFTYVKLIYIHYAIM